jgi:hypothetical protein
MHLIFLALNPLSPDYNTQKVYKVCDICSFEEQLDANRTIRLS